MGKPRDNKFNLNDFKDMFSSLGIEQAKVVDGLISEFVPAYQQMEKQVTKAADVFVAKSADVKKSIADLNVLAGNLIKVQKPTPSEKAIEKNEKTQVQDEKAKYLSEFTKETSKLAAAIQAYKVAYTDVIKPYDVCIPLAKKLDNELDAIAPLVKDVANIDIRTNFPVLVEVVKSVPQGKVAISENYNKQYAYAMAEIKKAAQCINGAKTQPAVGLYKPVPAAAKPEAITPSLQPVASKK